MIINNSLIDFSPLSHPIGICVKSFKVNSNEKFFINVCQAPEVPAPEDVTEEELIAILESTTPGSFRVPMSISEPRHTKDRSDKTVDVCDIAINPRFLVKIQKSQLFNNFFLQIVAEAMSEKYNVQLNMQKTITLNNRKFIGTLVSHRVRNDDVKKAQPGSQPAITGQDQAAVTPDTSGKLVQEINEKDAAAIRQIRSSAGGGQELQYKLRARVRDETVDEIHAEIYLPNCVSFKYSFFNLNIIKYLFYSAGFLTGGQLGYWRGSHLGGVSQAWLCL